MSTIFGDPGAVGRGDGMFVAKVYCKMLVSILEWTFAMNILSFRPTAPGSTRMPYDML